jgi:diketogulonate reductase-like aldo/keto reductase
LTTIAQKYNVTPNQVLLRYSLQKDWSPLPKSDNPNRIKTNADLYQFELSDDDMSTLDSLDQGRAGAICEAVVNR